ncbi:MAG: alpha/beta hydrolase [Planctomycetota bacterium]
MEQALFSNQVSFRETQQGSQRIWDTGGALPVLLMIPDGPCVIEHYRELIEELRPRFRVVCFEIPGFGYSTPNRNFSLQVPIISDLVIELMNFLEIPRAALAFTCSNGFYALRTANQYPDRITHVILAQTPSFFSMRRWTERIIPKPLRIPILGQTLMGLQCRKAALQWYKTALPRQSLHLEPFSKMATQALENGAHFCLASLVQNLAQTDTSSLVVTNTPVLAIYGDSDFSHLYTDFTSILEHAPSAKLVKFEKCGHLPDIEKPQKYTKQITDFIQ